MKRKILMICIIFCLPFISTSLFAETDILGWGKAKWGMTLSQIAKLYDIKGLGVRGEHYACELKEKIKIQGHDFIVIFWFDEPSPSGKLYQVALVAQEKISDSNMFRSVLGLLIEKYGKPDSYQLKSFSKTSLWLKTSGQLEFKTSIPEDTVYCAIEYTAVGSDADKL